MQGTVARLDDDGGNKVREVMPLPKQQRVDCRSHLAFVGSLPCSVPGCRRGPIQVHHLRCVSEAAMGRKAGDQWCTPLCLYHHIPGVHAAMLDGEKTTGGESGWWKRVGIDPIKLALRLWAESHRVPL